MRTFHAATLAIAALLLGACGGSTKDAPGPTNPLSGNNQPAAPPPATFHAVFAPGLGALPYPNDLYFVDKTTGPSTDGTLRLPTGVPTLPNAAAINGLDGFSTTAAITVDFSGPIDATTLNPADVVVIRLTLDNATKGPSLPPAPGAQLPRPLAYGTDYTVYVSGDPKSSPAGAFSEAVDGGGAQLVIQPTHPLDPSSGATNIGYIVLLTNGIKDTGGNAATPDTDYATVRNAALADLQSGATTPTCASITDATLNGICRLTFGHLAIAAKGGLNPANVVLSFSFSTQSTADTLNVLWQIDQATPVAPGTAVVAPSGLTTKVILASHGIASPGLADIWLGRVTVPYFLTAAANPQDAAALGKSWTAAGPSPAPGIDPTSRKLTRFNPVPAKTADLPIPLLLGVPNANSGCTEPAKGWPVVVFQHGVHLDRSYVIAVMDAYASQCFVVAAIDMPLHGITDPTNPLYRNQVFAGTQAAALITPERTFDLDLINNQTNAPGPDGKIDDTGTWFVNTNSFLTTRDNLRQAQADLLWLAHVLPTLSLGANINGTSDVDGTRLQIGAESLGSMIAIGALSVANTPYLSGGLSSAGGAVAYLYRDSADYGPFIAQLAASKGVQPGMTLFDNFLRDVQTAIDSGDPINFVAAAVVNRPILFERVVGGGVLPDSSLALPDQVIPNQSAQRLISAVNLGTTAKFTRIATPGVTPLPAGTGAYVNFLFGDHGNILYLNPADGAITLPSQLAVSSEMQFEAVTFAVAQGAAVSVRDNGSPSVVQP